MEFNNISYCPRKATSVLYNCWFISLFIFYHHYLTFYKIKVPATSIYFEIFIEILIKISN